MKETASKPVKYRGRFSQIWIFFGKFIRMFVYQSDWKVIPIGAVIAAVVTLVVGNNLFVTQEGTSLGAFALVCVCIWNGFFNSIQVVCRERAIVKREHRAGMYVSSYIAAHMIYQLILCVLLTLVTILICLIVGVQFPAEGVITPWGIVDVGITILLCTYAADLMALMVSCLVRTTTTAMTVMPFLLIFQLIFSGGFFELEGLAEKIKVITISHWGLDNLCSIGQYNQLPMVTLWNTLIQFKDVSYKGQKPLQMILVEIEQNNMRDDFLLWSGAHNAEPAYAGTVANVLTQWGALILLGIIFAVIAVIALRFIDRDKR